MSCDELYNKYIHLLQNNSNVMFSLKKRSNPTFIEYSCKIVESKVITSIKTNYKDYRDVKERMLSSMYRLSMTTTYDSLYDRFDCRKEVITVSGI